MSAACACRLNAAPTATLIQLHRQFTADCSQFHLSVETDDRGWMARVCDSNAGPALYSALRSSIAAAKIAAADFAALRTGDRESPELIAQQLPWHESW
jgi:hypothetical protein